MKNGCCIIKAKTELLIRNGANPSVRNDNSETPAHNAAKAGNLDALKVLVEKGGLSGILMGNLQSREPKPHRQNSRKRHRFASPGSKSYVSSMQVRIF